MNSFIAWIGGKKLLKREIVDGFPQSKVDTYVEVFGGAGWVLFDKDKHANFEIFNDIDGNLINLYRCIKYHVKELQRELDCMLVSREMFCSAKAQLSVEGLTDIQRAARYFYIIKTSFGAKRETFGANKRNICNSIDHLSEIQKRLKDVVIEHKDFERLIEIYDKPDTLFYLDPPYYEVEKFYSTPFSKDDHLRLNGVLRHLKGKFVLSYNSHPAIVELYKDFSNTETTRSSNLSNKVGIGKRYSELIIKNY